MKEHLARFGKEKRHLWLRITCLILLTGGLAGAGNGEAGSPIQLTPMEKQWLKAHPVIRLAPDPHFSPIEFFDEDGKYQGITADYISLIEKKIGIRFTIVRLHNWEEIVEKARNRQVDMFGVATKSPRRSEYMLFTTPLLKLPGAIIVRKEVKNTITMDVLRGMKVAIVSGYVYQEFISKDYPEMELDLVPDISTGLRKVSFGMVDAMVNDLATTTYYIERDAITNLRVAGDSGYAAILALTSRNDWPELNGILEKALARITPGEKKAIYHKWITIQQDSLFKSRKFWISSGAGAGVFLLFLGGILMWNRTLRRRVEEKTSALKLKVIEHQKAEKTIQESETRYRQIIDNTKNGVAVLKAGNNGEDFIFLDLNKSGETIDNLKKEAVIDRSVLDVFPGLKEFGLFDVLKRVWDTGRPEHHPIALYRDSRISVWRDTFVYKLPSGEIVTVYSDETELKALQAETLRAGHLASIGELAAGVAHEINNPINSVINLAQILVNECGREGLEQDVAGRIIKEGNRIAGIVGSLLAFARDRKDYKNPVNVRDIMNETLALTKTQVKKDGIDLKMDIQADLPDLMGHLQQIQQVFLNIINNARYALNQKYPDGDENKIFEITAEQVIRDSRPWVRVTFLDHGMGIPVKNIEHVMDPFFTTKPAGDGTGLGLSIGHGIISDHGGRLKLESSEGGFTRVIIDLPAGETNGT